MPTRKQRRRRDKDFRHDVRVFEVDEEGNETPISALRALEEKEKPKPAKAPAKVSSRGGRAMREVQPPSWDRAFKRGGLMGALMVVLFIVFLKNGPIATRVAIPVFYGIAFIPLTYWIDRTAYRSYLKRMNRQSAPKAKPKQPAAKKS